MDFRSLVYFKAKNAKKFRHGMEYGSARWGTAKDIEPYVDPVFDTEIPGKDIGEIHKEKFLFVNISRLCFELFRDGKADAAWENISERAGRSGYGCFEH